MDIKLGILSGLVTSLVAISPSFAAVDAALLQGSNLDLHGTPTGDTIVDFVDRGATITKTVDALAVATDDYLNLSAGIDKNVVITGNNLQFVGTASVINKFGDPTIDFNRDNSQITAEGGSLNIQSGGTIKLIGDAVRIDHNSLKFVNDPKYPIPTIDFSKAGAKITAEDGVLIEGDKGLQVEGPFKVGGTSTFSNSNLTGNLSVNGTGTFGEGVEFSGVSLSAGTNAPAEPCQEANLYVWISEGQSQLLICQDGAWSLVGPPIVPG